MSLTRHLRLALVHVPGNKKGNLVCCCRTRILLMSAYSVTHSTHTVLHGTLPRPRHRLRRRTKHKRGTKWTRPPANSSSVVLQHWQLSVSHKAGEVTVTFSLVSLTKRCLCHHVRTHVKEVTVIRHGWRRPPLSERSVTPCGRLSCPRASRVQLFPSSFLSPLSDELTVESQGYIFFFFKKSLYQH